ncbi:HEPN domain-containing protein [Candidatus Woesearchaeota archaeon]|nr:HEPN domain-containing protein [Candidatus Woesearchaeota archaeon]
MRQEILNWWEQAGEDFKNAKLNYDGKAYYVAVFLCQQAVEKGLKAVFMIQKKESPGKTHSLVYLAKEIRVPKEFIDFLVSLTPEFVSTRYPDVSGEIPARLYTDGLAKEILKKTGGFMSWLGNQMRKH